MYDYLTIQNLLRGNLEKETFITIGGYLTSMSIGYVPNPVFSKPKEFLRSMLGFAVVSRRIEAIYLLKHLKAQENDKILDGGCGDGILTIEIAKRCKEVVGADLSEDNLKAARHNLEQADIKNVKLTKANLEKLPFKQNSFDKVFSNCVMEHVKGDKKAFTEFHRVLKTGGKLVLTVASNEKNVGEGYIPLVPLIFRLPKRLRGIFCAETVKLSKSPKDFQKKQLFDKWHHVRKGYSRTGLQETLEKIGFRVIYSSFYLRLFGSLSQDIRCTIRGGGSIGGFCITYPLALLDFLLPFGKGYGIAMVAVKK